MTNAAKDENGVSTLITASKNDGTTVTRIYVAPGTHGLIVNDNTTGSDHGRTTAYRDDNAVPVLMAISSGDGVTPIEVYGDPATGALWVDST